MAAPPFGENVQSSPLHPVMRNPTAPPPMATPDLIVHVPLTTLVEPLEKATLIDHGRSTAAHEHTVPKASAQFAHVIDVIAAETEPVDGFGVTTDPPKALPSLASSVVVVQTYAPKRVVNLTASAAPRAEPARRSPPRHTCSRRCSCPH